MAFTLKPGETLARWWGPEPGKWESPDKGALVPERYANGRLGRDCQFFHNWNRRSGIDRHDL